MKNQDAPLRSHKDWQYVQPWLSCSTLRAHLNESGTDGSRSSKTTDVLNRDTIWLFKKHLPKNDGWSFKTEYRIPCSRGDTFTVDVAIFKNNILKAVVLLKAIEKSYNKNRHNYANTLEGEVGRVKYSPTHTGVSVITVDWIPREVPAGDKFEKTKVPNQDCAEKYWNERLDDSSFVSFNKIRFDANPIGLSHDSRGISNIEGVEKLYNSIVRLRQIG